MTPSIVRFCTRVAFVGLVAAFVFLLGRRHETEPAFYLEDDDGIAPDPYPTTLIPYTDVWRSNATMTAPSPAYIVIGTTQRQTH